MSCIAVSAFWLAVGGATCLTFGFVLPCWLGRRHADGGITVWGLWYRMDCGRGNCSAQFEVLDDYSVPAMQHWVLELALIPALATVALVTCHVGMTLLELLTCRCCCRPNCNPRRLVVVVASSLGLAGIFSVLTLIMAFILYDEFYGDNSVNHLVEFPWSALLYGAGAILLTIAAVFYTVVTCNWDSHSDFFGYQKPWRGDNIDTGDGAVVGGSMFRYSRSDSFKGGDVIGRRRSSGRSFTNRFRDSQGSNGRGRPNGDSLKRSNKDEQRNSLKRSSKRSSFERSRSQASEDSPPRSPPGFINSAYSSDSLDRSNYFDFRISKYGSDSLFKRSDSDRNIGRSESSVYKTQTPQTRSMSDITAVDLRNSRKARIDHILQSVRDVSALRESKMNNSSKIRDSNNSSYSYEPGKSEIPSAEARKAKIDKVLRSVRKLRRTRNTDRLRNSNDSNYSAHDMQRSKRDMSAFAGDSNIELRSSATEIYDGRETQVIERQRNPTVLDILARESMDNRV